MAGTDHPFFPPLDGKESDSWPSVTTNYQAIQCAFDGDTVDVTEILGGNAARILDLA